MNKIISLPIAIVLVIVALFCTAGCSSNPKSRSSETIVSETTNSNSMTTVPKIETSKAIEEPTTVQATEPQTTEPEIPEQIADESEELKEELTSAKWLISKVYEDGVEKNVQIHYGSIIIQTGAYLEFYNDNTFKCVLGFVGCEGTYTIDNGDVTVHITGKYDGTSVDSEDTDEYQTLIWDKDEQLIYLELSGVTNQFKKKSAN